MPRGGKRSGSGRPKGAKNSLPQGVVAAVNALNHRVPAGATPEASALAGRAFGRIVAVMDGKVHSDSAFAVLTAARTVREEICGPIPKKLEHGGSNGGPLTFHIDISGADSPGPEEES